MKNKPNKSDVFIDLSKCSEEQREYIFSLLPKPEFECQYEIDKYNFMLDYEDYEWWVNGDKTPVDKTELTYPEFIKLFEGGEGEKQTELEIWLNRQIEKCQELDMPREEWAYIQVLKKINSK